MSKIFDLIFNLDRNLLLKKDNNIEVKIKRGDVLINERNHKDKKFLKSKTPQIIIDNFKNNKRLTFVLKNKIFKKEIELYITKDFEFNFENYIENYEMDEFNYERNILLSKNITEEQMNNFLKKLKLEYYFEEKFIKGLIENEKKEEYNSKNEINEELDLFLK